MNIAQTERAFQSAFSRRALLTAAPALALAPAAALAGRAVGNTDTRDGVSKSGQIEDSILPIYREWLAARAEWYELSDLPGNEDWEWPESKAAENREWAAFEAMLETRPTTMEGVAALAAALWAWEGPCWKPSSPEYSEALDDTTNRLIAAIWKASSGSDGLPPHSDPREGRAAA